MELTDLSITLVEPSPIQQRIIMNYLHDMGITKTDWHQDATTALEAIRREKPDLVISAMHLPDRTGTELAQTISSDPGMRDTLFMLVSSETSYRYLEPLKQAGVVAILPKPFAQSDLRNALDATLDYLVPDTHALDDVTLESVRVLIVDDSVTARHQILRMLNTMGIHNVVEVSNGRYAINEIKKEFFDLVVTDYNMPEMDGQDLTHYIREHSLQRSIPILMVTSESDDTRLAQVQKSGVSAICDKPFDPANIKDLIRKMLAGD